MANDDEPEVIRHQMEETRTSLTEKVEKLEQQVVETVQGATTAVTETVATVKEAVQDTMDTVKGSVQDTVETVKSTLDFQAQTERHPWLMVSGSVVAGFLAGRLLARYQGPALGAAAAGFSHAPATSWAAPTPNGGTPASVAAPAAAREAERPSEPGWLDEVSRTFGTEIAKVKGLAIGALLGVVRDLVKQAVPDKLGPQLAEVVDSVTTKLGGRPIQGPVLEGDFQEMLFGKGSEHEKHDHPEMGRPTGSAQREGQAALGPADRR